MNVRMLAGATLAIVGLIATGCGGSSSSSTTSTALTKSEFLAKGNAICAKGNKTISQAAKQTFGNSKPSASQLRLPSRPPAASQRCPRQWNRWNVSVCRDTSWGL